jgi:hypothetical protein
VLERFGGALTTTTAPAETDGAGDGGRKAGDTGEHQSEDPKGHTSGAPPPTERRPPRAAKTSPTERESSENIFENVLFVCFCFVKEKEKLGFCLFELRVCRKRRFHTVSGVF